MRKTFLIIGAIFFTYLYSNSQSSFVHINSKKLDSSVTDYYGESINEQLKNDFSGTEFQINYNPAIYFDGIEDYVKIKMPISELSQVTVYTIFNVQNDSISEGEVWGIQGEEASLGLTTKKAFNSNKVSYYSGAAKGETIMHTYMQLHRSGMAYPNLETSINMGVTKKDSSNIFFKGSIAELIVYKKRLRGTTRQKIESYLALKYGIALQSGENYISSNKKVIWDTEEDVVFSNHIAGIGRDDEMALYQKQSSSANQGEFLVLSADKKAISNIENNAEFENRNFLVWGDNNEDLKLESTHHAGRPALMNRKWIIKATGPKANEITTQLQINAALLFDGLKEKNDYLLVIDQSGNGDFLPENTKYIQAADLSTDGKLIFENLIWDADNSGKDLFTFAYKKPLTAELSSSNPLICPNSLTDLKYLVSGGISPYQYNLISQSGFVKQWTDAEEDVANNATLAEISSGIYTLSVTDFLGDTISTDYSIEETPEITVDLGADKTLKFEQTLLLEARISQPEKVSSYEWTNETGFSSTDPLLETGEAGLYTLKVTATDGCEYTDSVYVNESFIQEFEIYPNPSPDGKFDIAIALASRENIKVSVFNVQGVLIADYEAKNKQATVIKATKPVRQSGIYDVILQTPEETVSKKLIVE